LPKRGPCDDAGKRSQGRYPAYLEPKSVWELPQIGLIDAVQKLIAKAGSKPIQEDMPTFPLRLLMQRRFSDISLGRIS